MAKYSFKEECDNLDRLAREMRENLQKCAKEAYEKRHEPPSYEITRK